MYNNKFFSARDDALAFKKEHGGVLIELTPRGPKATRARFMAEIAVAMDARGERVNPAKTPFCVAWNEPPFTWKKEEETERKGDGEVEWV